MITLEDVKMVAIQGNYRLNKQILADGKSIKEIADLLFISPLTIRRHQEHHEEIEPQGDDDLMKYAVAEGYISPD